MPTSEKPSAAPRPGIARIEPLKTLSKASPRPAERQVAAFPGIADFLLNSPLYAEFAVPPPDDQKAMFFTGIKIDGHCPSCGRETTFSSTSTRGQWGGSALLNEVATLACAREATHRLMFWVRTTKVTIQKIGQFPSQADIANDQSKAYRKVLSRDDAAEFHRAIGLASHGVGIGSFVYLRRIFERLIWKRFEEFEVAEGWDKAAFTRMAMAEKVALLKDHLPDFLVENARLYSIMSLGVHELSDSACLAFFPVLSESITTILDDDNHKKAELERRARLRKAIQSFETGA